MYVRMMQQVLSPGVQHAEKADLGAEMSGIGGDFQQCGGTGAEQEAVEQLLVMKHERRQLMRKREDHMNVGNVQQFFLTRREPLVAGVALALRAMAIAAGVIRDGLMAAARASIAVAAERCRATAQDRRQHLAVQ